MRWRWEIMIICRTIIVEDKEEKKEKARIPNWPESLKKKPGIGPVNNLDDACELIALLAHEVNEIKAKLAEN